MPIDKKWKSKLAPFKAYLQAIHPAPEDAKPQLKNRYWNLKATYDDFNWENGIPTPKHRVEVLKSIPIDKALAEQKPGEVVRAEIVYEKNGRRNAFTISINDKHDAKNLNTLFSLNDVWFKKYERARKNFDKKTQLRRSEREQQLMSANRPYSERMLDAIMRKDYPTDKFVYYTDVLDSITGWLQDRGITWKFLEDGYEYEHINSIEDMHFRKDLSSAKIRPVNYERAGPAYKNTISNCALVALKDSMLPLTSKEEQIFNRLQTKYQSGVWSSDYEDIAKKLKISLKVVYAPSTYIGHKWVESAKQPEDAVFQTYGYKSKRTINLVHWSNHATAMPAKPKHEYRFVSEEKMREELNNRYEQIYSTSESSITFRNRSDGVFDTIQLQQADGVVLELGKPSAQSTLIDEYYKQIMPYPYNDPNRPVYDTFAHHGIHYSTGMESNDDIDLDLCGAYSNYYNFGNYRGLPCDITYWYNNPTIDEVRANVGKVYAKFIEPLSNEEITFWVSTYEVEFLHDNGYLIEMYQAALAHKVFDLDLHQFIGPNIHKRVFHKILGLSTGTKAHKRFYTTCDIEVQDMPTGDKIYLPKCLNESDHELALSMTKSITAEYPIQSERYLHVAGVIQGLVTCQVWKKYVDIKKSNPNAKLVSALVDGLRFSKTGFDKSLVDLEDGKWAFKPIKYSNSVPQFDWATKQKNHQMAKLASDALIRVDGPIAVKPAYIDLLSVHKEGMLSFVDLVNEGYIHSIQGAAGCGKSYLVRQLLEQFNAIILTPTHSTREDMESYSIREYIDDDELLNKIPVKTYQSVIQRSKSLNDYSVVIVDEAGMLVAEHLNRLVEICQRKLIVLVGDPNQHKPIKGNAMLLHAKYLVYKDYINADAELSETYNNGSDWERNNMLAHLRYDCTFEEPTLTQEFDSEEERFDAIELLRERYVIDMKNKVRLVSEGLSSTIGVITTATHIDAFDCYTGGKILTDIKRATDDAGGRALIDLCQDVRTRGYPAIKDFVATRPEYVITPDQITNDASIIASLNISIDKHNNDMLNTLQANEDKQTKIRTDLQAIIDNSASSQVEKDLARVQMLYNYPDVEINVVARETIVVNKDLTVYNGTKGILKNFVLRFGDATFPLAQIKTPARKTKLNPFKKPTLVAPKIQPCYAITSYRAQGRTLTNSIVIDCTAVSDEMLYVAVSRATTIDQLRFVIPEKVKEFKRREVSHGAIVQTSDLKFGFRVSNAKSVMIKSPIVIPHVNDTDFSEFDWSACFATADRMYKKEKNTNYDEVFINVVSNKIKAFIKAQYPESDAPVAIDHKKDFQYLYSIGQPIFKLSDRKRKIRITDIELNGDEYTDEYDLPFVCRVDVNGIMGYYEFVDYQSMDALNRKVSSDGYECHQINVEEECSYFMDIDLKLHKDTIIEDLQTTNTAVSDLLVRSINETANVSGIQYTISQRSRELDDTHVKISLHIYTNLRMTHIDAKQFTSSLKDTIRNIIEVDDEELADRFCVIYEDIIDAIDCAQYHKNGGLALPGGRKHGVKSTIIRSEIKPLISVVDGPKMAYYREEEQAVEYKTTSQSFIDVAMAHTANIVGHEAFDFDTMRKGRPSRVHPSHCNSCNRVHDNDNTLILTFSEEKRCAWYHCDKDDNRKFVVFYKEDN